MIPVFDLSEGGTLSRKEMVYKLTHPTVKGVLQTVVVILISIVLETMISIIVGCMVVVWAVTATLSDALQIVGG